AGGGVGGSVERGPLVERARAVRANAHAPYSGFAVGAALLAGDGRIFVGVNVESAAFPAGVCAERAALAAALAAGARELVAIAVAGSGHVPCVPCGVCRQALHDLAPGLEVLAAGEGGEAVPYRLHDLLPHPFGP
ncbi:MAG TPA: cytidine deaminase, partial [Egibacteraceae bacterium]|nr:cytidine deaminase [Egibacteraceae bacterium]